MQQLTDANIPARETFWNKHVLLRELVRDQIPATMLIFGLALVVAYLQNGQIPGADKAFPVAGVLVPIWHLLWMGFWTGYIMGLVGEASGILSLPYMMTILQYEALSVSPTSLIVTFLNPFGALLGFWRNRQWNLDLAKWLCLGAVLGSPIGPFLRIYLLNDPVPFKAIIGLSLLIMSIHLCIQTTPWYLRRTVRQRSFKEKFDQAAREAALEGKAPSGLPPDFKITTVERSFRRVTVSYWGEQQTLGVPAMLTIGFAVGVAASALGVGGGFILVPIMVTFYGLPMYVLVAATIPFVITLSLAGLFTYTVTMPLLTGVSTSPDWSFGLFVASGAILGAWLASKTQKFIPERYLKPMLGTITGVVALLYIVNFFYPLSFRV